MVGSFYFFCCLFFVVCFLFFCLASVLWAALIRSNFWLMGGQPLLDAKRCVGVSVQLPVSGVTQALLQLGPKRSC